jgi:threonine/homoserine/homoserine lactone efflux protein
VTAYRQGLFSNLSNPKIIVFFLSLLPQFVTRSSASFLGLLLLGGIFCAITLTWLTLYAIVVARIGDFLRRNGVRRAIEATTGVVLVGLGLRLATNPR